jgi:hypothetical protein
MAVMFIMHETYGMVLSSLEAYVISGEGEFSATRNRIAEQAGNYPRRIVRDRARGCRAGVFAGSRRSHRLKQP